MIAPRQLRREEVLAQTPAAPWQLVRSFCAERPHPDKRWRNLLVWGDNLLALRELLADQQGPNRFGTRGKIRLIYIDPPFATRQDFMKDKEKAYQDKVLGSQFIEFLRRRLVLLREVLAEDGSIYVHLDTKKGHYIKAVLDEVFGEENFINQIVWKRLSAHNDAVKYGPIHDTIFFYTKSTKYVWNQQFADVSEEYVRQFFDQVEPDTGRRYARGDLTARGIRHGETGMPWRGLNPSEKGNHWKVPPSELERLGVGLRFGQPLPLDCQIRRPGWRFGNPRRASGPNEDHGRTDVSAGVSGGGRRLTRSRSLIWCPTKDDGVSVGVLAAWAPVDLSF